MQIYETSRLVVSHFILKLILEEYVGKGVSPFRCEISDKSKSPGLGHCVEAYADVVAVLSHALLGYVNQHCFL